MKSSESARLAEALGWEKEESRVIEVPLWANVQSCVVLLCSGLLLGVTALHWGGVYDHVGVPLMFCGVVLWGVVFALAIESYLLRQHVGDWVDTMVVVFLAYSLFSYARSEAGYEARLELMWTWVYGGLFVACRYGVHSRDWMIYFCIFIVSLAAVVCLFALVHKGEARHLIWGLPRPDYGARISGTFGCPNHFANFMAISTFIAFLLGTFSKFPWPLRIIFFYLSLMFTAGLFFSVSRGGYLAWMFGMAPIGGYVVKAIQVRWWWKAAFVSLVATGGLVTISRNDFVLGRLEQTLSGDVRLQLVVDAIRIWKQEPWFGTGMASFDFYHMRLTDFVTGRAVYTHNDYMNTLSDHGAIGLGIVILFLGTYTVFHILRGRNLSSERETLLWRVGLSSLVGMMVHEVVDFNLHIPACAILLFIVLGFGFGRTFRQRRTRRAWLSAAPLLIGASLVMFFTISPKVHQTWKGQRLADFTEEELLAMDSEVLVQLADEVYVIDPLASESQIGFANALRVKAARAFSEIRAQGLVTIDQYRGIELTARQALTIYERIYENNPLDDTLLIKKAMTYDSIGQRQLASMFYAQALSLRPHSANFHYAVGFHFFKHDQLEQALESFKKASQQGLKFNLNTREQVADARRMIKTIQKELLQQRNK